MGFLFGALALVALSVVAMRFGVDSRESSPRGWLVAPRRRGDAGAAGNGTGRTPPGDCGAAA
jgi:hypothetical protein